MDILNAMATVLGWPILVGLTLLILAIAGSIAIELVRDAWRKALRGCDVFGDWEKPK